MARRTGRATKTDVYLLPAASPANRPGISADWRIEGCLVPCRHAASASMTKHVLTISTFRYLQERSKKSGEVHSRSGERKIVEGLRKANQEATPVAARPMTAMRANNCRAVCIARGSL